jgi:hypothetical protein
MYVLLPVLSQVRLCHFRLCHLHSCLDYPGRGCMLVWLRRASSGSKIEARGGLPNRRERQLEAPGYRITSEITSFLLHG